MKFSTCSLTLALTFSLAACGGGGGGTSATTTLPVVVVPVITPSGNLGPAGVFAVNYGQFTGVYTFLDNGKFYGLHFVSGSTLAGHPHGLLTETNSTTHLEPISWANFIDDQAGVGAQEAGGLFGRTFSGSTLSVGITGSMGHFSATASTQKTYGDGSAKTLYNDPIPMSTIAGTYGGFIRSVGIDQTRQGASNFVIDAGGAFTVTAVACTFSGTMVQHGTTGVFDVVAQTSGAACRLSPALSGIVTPLSVINNAIQLGVQLNSADNSQTAVFIINRN